MLLRFAVCLSFLAGLYAGPLHAQPDPIKWGEVPDEDLAMTAFPADTNAAAVILADYAEVFFRPDAKVVMDRHIRIKILNETGYEWGDVVIPFVAEKGGQKVSNIKAQTYVRDARGRVRVMKLGKKDIFEEDIGGGQQRIRFTLPALEPGAVIEYRYTVRSENPFLLPRWTFQSQEPTRWSEYRVSIPAELGFEFVKRGERAFDVAEDKEVWSRNEIRRRWAMADVPALRPEPLMDGPSDYLESIELQLSSVYTLEIALLTSWQEMSRLALEAMTPDLHPDDTLRAWVATLTDSLADPTERLAALYDTVRTGFTWSGAEGFMPTTERAELLASRTGSAADLNALLIALLRIADLDADPVLVSTRDHGAVVEERPLLSQFNTFAAHLDLDGTPYVLDATNPLRPFDLPPARMLGVKGWRLGAAEAEWVIFETAHPYTRGLTIDATLRADGTLRGTLRAVEGGYSALNKRRLVAEGSPEDFARSALFDGEASAEIERVEMTNTHAVAKTLRAEADFVWPAYAQSVGDLLLVNPIIVDRSEDAVFTAPTRTYPVDFPWPYQQSYTLRLELPEGYEVDEYPADDAFGMEDGFYRRTVQVEEGAFMIRTQYAITEMHFSPEMYPTLRHFLERVVAAEAEQVVLKRTAEPGEE